MITPGIALVISAVFMLGINIFSPALSFLREGWFLPVFFAYIAVNSIYSVQNIAFISIRRADLSLFQNLLLGARIPILLLIAGLGVFEVVSSLGNYSEAYSRWRQGAPYRQRGAWDRKFI